MLNAMLAYIATYQHKASTRQLRIAVLSFYDEPAIETAKRDLLKGIAELDVDIGDAHKDRQNSTTRSAKEAAVDDVLHIFKVIDKLQESEKPRFCVEDVSHLPPAAPEAAGSRMTLFEMIARQERDMRTVIETLEAMRKDIGGNSRDIATLKNTNTRMGDYAAAVSCTIPRPVKGLSHIACVCTEFVLRSNIIISAKPIVLKSP